jgi:putative DNA primase/helicase
MVDVARCLDPEGRAAVGEGANGKSVWLTLLETFLGRENVTTLSLHRIEADKFAAARLVGRLCNIGTDLPTAALAGTSMLKALTGGDTITAERKYEASFEFRPYARLLFSANSAPRSDDATHGFFRRWLCIPFNRTFDESSPDTVPRAVLDARLSEPGELSGLLNRALEALPVIRTGRFTESASTRAALREFQAVTDPFAVWLEQATVEHPDAMVPKDRLRSAYAQICQEAGRSIMREEQFTAALKRLRPKVEPAKRRLNGKLTPVYLGLGFMTQDPVPEDLF